MYFVFFNIIKNYIYSYVSNMSKLKKKKAKLLFFVLIFVFYNL